MKLALAYYTGDSEGDYWCPIDLLKPFKDMTWKIKRNIKETINKVDHPFICKLLNRHILPEPTGRFGLDVFGPRKCLRCGEICDCSLHISPLLQQALNDEAEAFCNSHNAWKEYTKVSILPPDMKPAAEEKIYKKQAD